MSKMPIVKGPHGKDPFDQLEEVDRTVSAARNAAGSSESADVVDARKYRGNLSSQFGLAKSGLQDLEKAQHSRPDDMEITGLVGEATRVYARDVLLGGGVANRQQVVAYIRKRCLPAFTRAIEGQPDASANRKAWLYAHRGAANTLIVAMNVAEAPAFAAAKRDFERARELKAKEGYLWATQFEAFLHAVRGGPGDFETARRLLYDIRSADELTKATINRSLSMLFSYDATHSADAESARAGLMGASQDSEDFLSLYFAASSLRRLNQQGRFSEELVSSALESARVRAMNAFSQASAVLAAISILRNQTDLAISFLDRLAGPPANDLDLRLDLETLAMMSRDRTWDVLRDHPSFKRLMTEGAAPRPYSWDRALNPEGE